MGAMTVLVAGAATATGDGRGDAAITVLLALLGSTVLGTFLTTVVAGLRASATTRREGYAAAVQAFVSWVEYPYRIRRRTSDEPAALTKLADVGHDLQECLARHRAWVAAESGALSGVFDKAVADLTGPVGEACKEAWNSPPVTRAADMNLSGFGPGDVSGTIKTLECAVAYRFGLRRLLSGWVVRRRLRARGCAV